MANKMDAKYVGCLFDGHLGQYIYGEIVKLAEEYGYVPSDAFSRAYDDNAGGLDDGEVIIWESEKAEEWLNEHVAEDGYSFGWYDGEYFYCSDGDWEEAY